MAKKNSRNTKGRIISAAWKLFYEQGYEETTVEDIIFEVEQSIFGKRVYRDTCVNRETCVEL